MAGPGSPGGRPPGMKLTTWIQRLPGVESRPEQNGHLGVRLRR